MKVMSERSAQACFTRSPLLQLFSELNAANRDHNIFLSTLFISGDMGTITKKIHRLKM